MAAGCGKSREIAQLMNSTLIWKHLQIYDQIRVFHTGLAYLIYIYIYIYCEMRAIRKTFALLFKLNKCFLYLLIGPIKNEPLTPHWSTQSLSLLHPCSSFLLSFLFLFLPTHHRQSPLRGFPASEQYMCRTSISGIGRNLEASGGS